MRSKYLRFWHCIFDGPKLVATIGLAIFVIAEMVSPAPTQANDTYSQPIAGATSQLQNSVRKLSLWVNQSDDSQMWRKYLLLNLLETQSAKGDQASFVSLTILRDRFAKDGKLLKHPAINDVKLALDAQIARLQTQTPGDLRFGVTQAMGQYQTTSVAQIEYQRDAAVYELELLKKHYRATLPSRDRANLFYDLQLDEAIEFLKEIKVKLAPEVSGGKVLSLIRDVKKQYDEVEKALDAMPVTPEPDDDDTPEDQPEVEGQIASGAPNGNQLPLGPIPDSIQKTKQDLELEKQAIESRLKVLRDKRSSILKADKPRKSKRDETFRRLLQLEANFVKVSKQRTDPYFVSAAMSFEQFVRTYYYGTEDNLQEDYLRKLGEVDENLFQLARGDKRTATGKLGESLRWLENANQGSGLVAAIRRRYSNPNMYVGVSGKLLNLLASQDISTNEPLRENMGGRLIRGNTAINAVVNVELQDDPNQIRANIRLIGDLASSIYLQELGVQVYTGANGQLEAVRAIYANIGGLFSGDPKVAANISAYFSGTSSRLKLVNKFAAKKFAELQSETEGSTARTAEELLKEQFESQTDDVLITGREALRDAQDALLAKADLAPQLYLRSTNSQIVLVGKKSSISTLGAPDFPNPTTIPTDIGVRIHESFLSNFLDKTFSGKTFTDKELGEELAAMMGGETPAAFSPTDEEGGEDNSFSITFDSVRPIQFEFDNNGLGVSIAGRRFAQGDRKINTGLRIGLRFKIKRKGDKLKLVRDGKATIDYVGDKKDAKAVAFRSVLDGRLNPADGGEQIEVDLPDNLLPLDQIEQLKDNEIAKQIKLIQCRSENGWLYLGWNYQPENAIFQSQTDIPAIWTEATIYELSPSYTESDESLIVPLTGQLSPATETAIQPATDPNIPPLPPGAVLIESQTTPMPSIIEGVIK